MLNSRKSWFWLMLLGWLSLAACAPRSTTQDGDGSPAVNGKEMISASELLRDVLQRYRTAEFYRDRARVRLEYDTAQGPIRQDTLLALAYLAPHSMRLVIQREENEFHLSSDGKQTWAWVRDSQSDNLRHQVVQRTAPPRWSVSELYAATELANPNQPDQMLSLLMGLPLHLQYSPFGLIVGDSVWDNLVSDPSQISELAAPTTSELAGLPPDTRRIQVMSRDGRFVFWIDASLRSIRRLELPTGRLFAHLAPEKRPQSMRLVMDWQQIEWEPVAQSASLFSRSIQPDETLVRYFVLPPVAQANPVNATSPPKEASAEGAHREPIMPFPLEVKLNENESSRDWQGRVSVLVWFQDHPTSRSVLPQLQQIYEQLGGDKSDVVFRAICTQSYEQLDVGDLIQLTQSLGLTIPVRRDSLAVGRDQLNIREAPTTVILDGEMRVQLFEVGANPRLGELVRATLDRIAKPAESTSDAAQGPSATDEQEQLFQRQLQMARLEPLDAVPPTDLLSLPPARSFIRWKQDLLWENKELTAPGNVLLRSGVDDKPTVFVIENAQEVLELDDQGHTLERHSLLPEETRPITQWESAQDAAGQTFYLGYTRLAPFVEVFDGAYQRIFRYPPQGASDDELVQDAELLDLDQDGTLELYVAFDKNGGLHRADLSGNSPWQQRGMSGVYSVAQALSFDSAAPSARLLGLGEQGLLVPVRSGGQLDKPIEVGARTFYWISTAAAVGADRACYLGLSYTLEGRPIAIGLNGQFKELWSYGLPAGVHRSQVRGPNWSRSAKADAGIWWLAGADGSLHGIFDDGSQFDSFLIGEPITGFGADLHDQTMRVVVSSASGVHALRVTTP